MTLGMFGGSAPVIKRRSGFTGGQNGASGAARDRLTPSPEGQPASPGQLFMPPSNYGNNLLRNGNFRAWSSGTTSAPDAWTLSGVGASIARETTDIYIDETSSDLTNGASNSAGLLQSITISNTINPYLRGRWVTFSCWVKAGTASRVLISLDDAIGTRNSFQHSGGGEFEFLHVSMQISDTATKIEVQLEISSGGAITATFSGAMLTEGKSPAGFSPSASDITLSPRFVMATSFQSRSTTSLADLDSMSIDNIILNGSESVLASFAVTAANNTQNESNKFTILRDSTSLATFRDDYNDGDAGDLEDGQILSFTIIDETPAAGNYTYKIQWEPVGGTAYATRRALSIAKFPGNV